MSVVGLDVGTSRIKAVRFDQRWAAADVASEAAAVLSGDGGRREQDPAEVWTAVVRVLRQVTHGSPDPIELVAVTAQGDGCWLVDDQLRPVGPAALWNDGRASGQVAEWLADGTAEQAFRISGCAPAPGLANAQLRLLAETDPDRLSQADRLLSCGSWVYLRLTGRAVLDGTEAANPFFDARDGAVSPRLWSLFGLTDHQRLLPEIVGPGTRCAEVCATTAAETGLPPGVPVVLAPYDVAASVVGVGARETGDTVAILGTTFCVTSVAGDPATGRPMAGFTLPAEEPGRWLLAHATMVGTEVLDWAARALGVADAAAVVDLAGRSSHPDPPVLAPYLSPAGERSPFLDAGIRGTLLGLELGHEAGDLAYAAVDGLALVVRDCLPAGVPERLLVCGGAARSAPLCQLISDTVGVPVVAADTAEVGARGAALVAAAEVGQVGSLAEAVTAAIRPGRRFDPDSRRTAAQDDRYERMTRARDALRSRPSS